MRGDSQAAERLACRRHRVSLSLSQQMQMNGSDVSLSTGPDTRRLPELVELPQVILSECHVESRT